MPHHFRDLQKLPENLKILWFCGPKFSSIKTSFIIISLWYPWFERLEICNLWGFISFRLKENCSSFRNSHLFGMLILGRFLWSRFGYLWCQVTLFYPWRIRLYPRALLPPAPSPQDHRVRLEQNRNWALHRNGLSSKSNQSSWRTGKNGMVFHLWTSGIHLKAKCIFIYN